MRVFVTGATGFIGSAIVRELVDNGHHVLGLARSDAAVDALARLGVEAHRGDLSNPESLVTGARACDGVIHMAFNHDYSNMADNLDKDRRAIEALGAALGGHDPTLVVPFVTLALTPGRVAKEEDTPDPNAFGASRIPSEQAALVAASRGVRASVVRLPISVHGEGDHGMVGGLISTAREKGVLAYVGDGTNRWPAVHRLDVAHLFRLALEKGADIRTSLRRMLTKSRQIHFGY
jgi:nucleoside-diphosphate-sugar epimerase